LYEETNPDWAPSLHLGYASAVPDESRYARLQQRTARKRPVAVDESVETRRRAIGVAEGQVDTEASYQTVTVATVHEEHQSENVSGLSVAGERTEFLSVKAEKAALQSENTALKLEIETLKSENGVLKSEITALNKELEELKKTKTANFTEAFLKEKENENILKFYTGIVGNI